MKVKHLSILAGAGSLLLAGGANADFLGIDIIDFTNFLSGAGAGEATGTGVGSTVGMHPNAGVRTAYAAAGLRTFRVYAMFNAADRVLAHGGHSSGTAWASSTSGSFFNQVEFDDYNNATHYNTPSFGGFTPTSRAWDTFGTIGRHVGDSNTNLYANNEAFAAESGNLAGNWSMSDSGWFSFNPLSADNIAKQATGSATDANVQGVAADGIYRVLLLQITVGAGEDVEGNIGLLGGQLAGVASAYEVTGEALYYNSVPAPGALALLGLAGLAGARRRRA
ncbi:MAG TPA: hypothetical protein PK400_11400 [Phycisphaerales bacterium]|nr:hypothetical protein [Phycisphaerales bacterium]HRQ76308.1 hypothetical protein [Phycisphaerales bacterium]